MRRLSTDAELLCYAEGFRDEVSRRSGGRMRSEVPLDYLRRCAVVRGAFTPDGRMVAGYAIGSSLPLRLHDFLPDDVRSTLQPPGGRSWEDCCEIVCMWRHDDLPHAQMDRAVWPRVAWDAVRAGKPYILGHNENPRLDKRYAWSGMDTLYEGSSVKGHPSRLVAYTRSRLVVLLIGRGLQTLARHMWGPSEGQQ